jgi:predicted MPP superfamily phosphohydrolase
MMFLPSLIRFYSLRSSEKLSKTLAYVGYTWMTLLFFFFTTSILFDIYNLIIKLSGVLLQKDMSRALVSTLTTFYVPLLLALPLGIYSYFEAQAIHVKRLVIKSQKLAKEIGTLTIAHISDLHLGIMVKDGILDKVIKEIEKAKPDIIVSTGDILEDEVNHVAHLSDKLNSVHARLGKFAVTGNHDFFVDIESSLRFMDEAGFKTLRGEGRTIQGLLNIAGVDDPTVKNVKTLNTNISERDVLSKLPLHNFTILLKHRPDVEKSSLGLFDLQLSGHTHGGQFFPINFIIMPFFKHRSGYTKLSKDSSIYVSRGVGTACSPIRFLSPPELTFIKIVSAKAM